MRKLFLCLVASIILSSCTSNENKENGRYNIISHEYRGIIVIDTQTGILYYPNPGEKDWLYEDIITTAKKDPEL
jgi:hypothetical protein